VASADCSTVFSLRTKLPVVEKGGA